jgi:2-oxoglutarate dehydrogenase E1 component
VRVEGLHTFPDGAIRSTLARYPAAQQIVWTQEEPRNMGAWTFVAPRLAELLPAGAVLRYVGRPDRASPAEGYANAHSAEQARIVAEALAG